MSNECSKSGFSIDWLAFTVPQEQANSQAYRNTLNEKDLGPMLSFCAGVPADEVWVMQEGGMFGYTRRATSASGIRALWSPGQARMGVHIIFTGEPLLHFEPLALIVNAVKKNSSLTRLDICYDDKEASRLTTVADYVRRYQEGQYTGRKRKYSEIKSDGGGHTLYIGSRHTDRMVRIYDKGAEQGGAPNVWVRVELELKGDVAKGIGKYINHYQGKVDWAAIINDFIIFSSSSAWSGMGSNELIKVHSTKGKKQTRKWLLQTMKSLALQIKLDPEFGLDLVAELRDHGISAELTVI